VVFGRFWTTSVCVWPRDPNRYAIYEYEYYIYQVFTVFHLTGGPEIPGVKPRAPPGLEFTGFKQGQKSKVPRGSPPVNAPPKLINQQ